MNDITVTINGEALLWAGFAIFAAVVLWGVWRDMTDWP